MNGSSNGVICNSYDAIAEQRYERGIRAWGTSVVYERGIQAGHTSVAYKPGMQAWHTSVAYDRGAYERGIQA